MHPAVIEEVSEKTPTPVFRKANDGKNSDSSVFLKFLKGGEKDTDNGI
jgi:hypothetical protein